ncbi:recombinase family protein [Streptomyces sp. RPT161]|uniref:recombinase family protein n=1 Tax=Streptomyces sp. RPT161 TaxID=3015993 RepID=UPI0022B8FE08|nr:recombinase family protein [Streptomyces sp. RPT161]
MSAKALEPPRDASQHALVFVYDRHATLARDMLLMRLETCAEYAEKKGWRIAGWWVDQGDDALTNDKRPAFGLMLNTIRAAGTDVPRVVLVHDWHRFSRDDAARGLFTRKVLHLGGWVETCQGEKRLPDGTYVQRPCPNGTAITT